MNLPSSAPPPHAEAIEQAKFELLLELAARGETAKMRAWGRSMRGAIEPGTLLLLGPKQPHPELFDVVCVRVNGELVIHRVVGIGLTPVGVEVLIAGDFNPRPDGWVPYASVLARVESMHSAAATAEESWSDIPDPFRPSS